MINVIIVDDEFLVQDVLEIYIEKILEIIFVQKCSNVLEVNEALKFKDVDLMFFDIQMLQFIGVDFLKMLNKLLVVIFIMVYFNYVIEGFEFNVLDYLLKLIFFECFMKAINKVIEQIELK